MLLLLYGGGGFPVFEEGLIATPLQEYFLHASLFELFSLIIIC